MEMLARTLEAFLDLVFPPKETAETVRTATKEEFAALLDPRITASGSVALLPYRHRLVRATILEAKFKRNPKALMFLADALRDYYEALIEESVAFKTEKIVFVPIPLGKARRKERGYNQTEEVARMSGCTFNATLLQRTRDTVPQTTLSRTERLHNMQDAFMANGPLGRDTTYIVLDDVTTTGATLDSSVEALKNAGAADVRALALAH